MNDKTRWLKHSVQLAALTGWILFMVAAQLWADETQTKQKMGFFDVLMLPRVWMGALFCLAGALMLMRAKLRREIRITFLALAFFAFGVLTVLPLGQFARGMGLHPSPVCTVTKPFLFVNAGRGIPIIFPAILFSIAVFSIVGNKLFCGWVCPVGALQEIVHEVPLPRRAKIKLPFKVTNWIRVLLFIVFVPLVFVIGKSVYDYVNPFEALHWGFGLYEMIILAGVLIAGLFVFRPFCYLACPLGLFTWILEQISVLRIKVDPDKCTMCFDCIDSTPCPAMSAIVEGKRYRPDCHVCGNCLDKCDEGAIRFTVR